MSLFLQILAKQHPLWGVQSIEGYPLTVLEAVSLKSRCEQGCVLSEGSTGKDPPSPFPASGGSQPRLAHDVITALLTLSSHGASPRMSISLFLFLLVNPPVILDSSRPLPR